MDYVAQTEPVISNSLISEADIMSNGNLPDSESVLLSTLSRDADELLGAYSQNVTLRSDRGARKAAFAAHEAVRVHCGWGLQDLWYGLFVVASFIFSVFIGLVIPESLKSTTWDIWGLASTFVLLSLTYGLYVLKNFWAEIRATVKPASESQQSITAVHVILCFSGFWLTWHAGQCLRVVWHEKALPHTDLIACNQHYAHFIGWILGLAVVFVCMDLWVALHDDSHSETFVAASSFIHSTVPMAIGIGVIGLYVFCDFRMNLRHGLDYNAALQKLPVEFASGALSFQMIMSNTLFAFIKRNFFVRFAHFATRSTKSA